MMNMLQPQPDMASWEQLSQFRRREIISAAAGLAAGFFTPSAAIAQSDGTYPSRPIQLIVPFPAGGGTDVVARTLAQLLSAEIKQPVVIDNRAGAAGIIGTQAAARAAPDGHTLVVGTTGTHTVNQFLYQRLPYNPDADFEPISLICSYNNALIVHPSFPAKTLQEFVSVVKASPKKYSYGIGANGSSSHLAVESFRHIAELDMVGIPYKGGAAAIADLLAGHVPILFDTVVSALPHIRSGKVRALATSALKRSHALPDVPTIAESGFRGFEAIGWNGLFTPARTPKPIIDRLHAATVKALASPAFDNLVKDGLDAQSSSPQELRAFMKTERDKWEKVIRASNIKAQ